jgi:regulator of sirC expression with transglutaminase-like and TPR domain
VSFVRLAAQADPRLDELALALAAEFREADAAGALARLDALGAEVAREPAGSAEAEAAALRRVLGERHGFRGRSDDYDHPDNSMLDLVLERCAGLPILLSVVYVEVARRAGIELARVGLPGHFVVGHFGVDPPLLLDPFGGGAPVEADAPAGLVRPWLPHETALRVLNNLVASYTSRHDLARAIRAAELRVALPLADDARAGLEAQLRALRARLN